MGFWGKRLRSAIDNRGEDGQQTAEDADLARRARVALVATDERIRSTSDEVAFAQAELGDEATKGIREGLDAVRTHMGEAFQLHQLNHDDIPDTAEELRTRNARIVQLCEWAENVLDERTEALKEKVEKVRRAPQIIDGVRREAEDLRARIPQAREVVDRLTGRYSAAAMQRVSSNPDEAEQLLDFAIRSAGVAERRRDDGRTADSLVAVETATESVRRAKSILDGVEDFEIEAMRAQSTIADVVADSRGDIVEARRAQQTPEVTAAIADLERALAELPGAGASTDPFDDLARVSEANAALDAAIDKARDRAANPVPSVDHVRHELDAADRAIGVARSVIGGHRGHIGADARTRLAEAERLRIDAEQRIASEDTRREAQSMARRAGQLANEALQLAQKDIDAERRGGGWDNDDWGMGGGRGGMGGMGGGILGPAVGGLLLGGLIGDMFD
ncbi:hypothetical protein [Microbacterium halophytorum]|uniref:hypothetical protein n=1 Tax=Microbacterium halophytorum TaxID=2067568 RepID=UPI000CFD6FC7|nr:hypothetical protein [Microbacterium halophytorum]